MLSSKEAAPQGDELGEIPPLSGNDGHDNVVVEDVMEIMENTVCVTSAQADPTSKLIKQSWAPSIFCKNSGRSGC